MASQKNAVSVNGTRSMHFTPPACTPMTTSGKVTQQSSKTFKKNVFLSAFLLSNIFFAEQAFALSVQPLQVKSALGEPFRAQIVISDIGGVDPATIKATLANDSEFIQLGINKKQLANDLHFTTVITSPERGIITISSDRPLNDPYIEFVVHIGFGNNVRLQQVTALVDPPLTRIKPETLNLPVQQIQLAEATSTPAPAVVPPNDPNLVKVTSSVTSRTIPLIPIRNAPPPMAEPSNQAAETPLAKEPLRTGQEKPLIPSSNTPPPMAPTANESSLAVQNTPMAPAPIVETTIAPQPAPAPAPAPAIAPEPVPPSSANASEPTPAPEKPVREKPAQETSTNHDNNSYKVKRHDSLWSIASRIQKDTNQPVTVIMRSIQQMNKAAFIHGNPNHIKNGAIIILPNQQDNEEAPKADVQSPQVDNDDVESNKTPTLRTPIQEAKVSKTPYVRRGRLPDAKMTLVAPALEGNAQGNASERASEEKSKQLAQLNVKITAARQRNLTLGQEVSELEAKIKANDQKLALRNARLAELMQRLKNRKDAAPQNANRTAKS